MSQVSEFVKEHDYACWCGERNARVICRQMRLGRRFVVLECTACGTHRILPKAIEDSSAAAVLYNEYQEPDFPDAVRAQFVEKTLRRMRETDLVFENGCRVLDVGCGCGDLIEAIATRFKCSGHGIDVDRRRIEKAVARCGQATFECGLFSPNKESPKNDIVISSAVIEHVPDPVIFLKQLGSGLGEEGSLFLLTPNARSLNYRILRSWWRELLSLGEHIFLFTPESLEACAAKAGFKLVKQSSDFDLSVPFWRFDTLRNALVSLWSLYRESVKRVSSWIATSDSGDILYAHFRKVS